MKLALIASAAVVAAMLAAPAQAVVVTFGGQVATDGSALTSAKISASNIVNPLTGYFIETFDTKTANPFLPPGNSAAIPPGQPAGTSISIVQGQGCSINSYGSVGLTTTGGGFSVQSGNNSSGANPAGDSTCYGFGPGIGSNTTTATITIDYEGFLAFLVTNGLAPAGSKISYLGLYYGSIDTYNDITFFNGNSLLTGAGIMSDGKITGAEVLASQGGSSGNQAGPGSNVYVNLEFDPSEAFTKFTFSTTGIAFELDNLVIGLTSRPDLVPEPECRS